MPESGVDGRRGSKKPCGDRDGADGPGAWVALLIQKVVSSGGKYGDIVGMEYLLDP